MTDQELHSPIERQFKPETLIHNNVYVCKGCAGDEKKGMSQAGFCGKSVLHRVAHEQQLDSVELKHVSSL
jgi:predicted metal-binding protein